MPTPLVPTPPVVPMPLGPVTPGVPIPVLTPRRANPAVDAGRADAVVLAPAPVAPLVPPTPPPAARAGARSLCKGRIRRCRGADTTTDARAFRFTHAAVNCIPAPRLMFMPDGELPADYF